MDKLGVGRQAGSRPGAQGDLPEIEPCTAWVIPKQASHHIGDGSIRAHARYDGETTAFLRFGLGSGVEIRAVTGRARVFTDLTAAQNQR